MSSKKTQSTLGERLRLARVIIGLSQLDLSRQLKLSNSGVLSNYEHDQRRAGREVLVPISEMVDVSLQWLTFSLGWTFMSGITPRLQAWIERRLHIANVITFLHYDDGRFGKAVAVMLETELGFVSAGGGGLRTGYRGGGVIGYGNVLEAVRMARASQEMVTYKAELAAGKEPEWNETDVAAFLVSGRVKRVKMDIEAEIASLRTETGKVSEIVAIDFCQEAKKYVENNPLLAEIVCRLEGKSPELIEQVFNMLKRTQNESNDPVE